MNNLFTSGIYALGLNWVTFRCFNSCIGILLINFNDLFYDCTCFLYFIVKSRFLEKLEFFPSFRFFWVLHVTVKFDIGDSTRNLNCFFRRLACFRL